VLTFPGYRVRHNDPHPTCQSRDTPRCLLKMIPKTFRYPLSRLAQWRRKLADRVGRRLGHAPRVVHAQGARFLVDTTDFIDQCIAWEGMWDGPQLDRLAAVSLAQPIGYVR
jgi:hypothetical protein